MATQLAEQNEEPLVVADDGGEEQTAPRDYEADARARGWRPPEEWPDDKPKPAKFRTAQEFIELEDDAVPLLRKKMDRQARELSELRSMVRKLSRSEQAAYENAMADIKAQQEAAVESGDLAAYRKLDGKMETLRKEAAADVAGDGEDPQEAYDTFREANIWYDKGNLGSASEVEVEARLYADRLADKYVRAGLQKEVTPSEFFARIAKETADHFPLLTAKKTRDKPISPVAGVTANGGARNAKNGANLPPEAKDHAERYMRMGISSSYKACKTKAEAWDLFAKSYDWKTT